MPRIPNRSNRRSRSKTGIGILAVLLLVLVIGVGSFTLSRVTEKTETFKVTRVLDQPTHSCSTSNGQGHCKSGHKYLVFTDHGTYKSTDSIWFFKFNSSDLIGQLEDGRSYRCDTTGFRFGLTSSYRNLIHCEELPS